LRGTLRYSAKAKENQVFNPTHAYDMRENSFGGENTISTKKVGFSKSIRYKEPTGMNQYASQMSLIYDTDEVIKKAILNDHGVHCRTTACKNLFSVLNDDEKSADYVLDNLDIVVNRFRNKNNTVKPATVKVYKSRVKSSLEDFLSWSRDPIAWERSINEKESHSGGKKARGKTKKTARVEKRNTSAKNKVAEESPTPAKPVEKLPKGARKISFPIRPDFDIEITIPTEGLTTKELIRLGLFLYPYCRDLELKDESTSWPTTFSTTTN